MKIIAYHGTSLENAEKIISSDIFWEDTWFAYDKNVSIKFGGPFIFKCQFNPAGFRGIEDNEWQFHLREEIKLNDIILKIEGINGD